MARGECIKTVLQSIKERKLGSHLQLFLLRSRLIKMAEAGASDEELSAEVRRTMDIIDSKKGEE